MVQKWSQADKRHLPGWEVLEIEGENATVHRPGQPGRITVPIDRLQLEPAKWDLLATQSEMAA